MRRRVNVAVASVLLFGLVYLFAHHQSDLTDTYNSYTAYPSTNQDGGTSSQPEFNGLSGRPSSQDSSSSKNRPLFYNGPTLKKFPAEPSKVSSATVASPAASTDPLAELATNPQTQVETPNFPPSENLEVAPGSIPETPLKEDGWEFQKDLDLDLPISALKKFSLHKPHNYMANGPKTYAYATFLSGHNPSLKDPFYLATHNVVHRVLWSQRSKTTKYPFVVFVAHYVSQEQRDLLSGAGAIVRELSPLEWDPHVPGIQKRWKDLFAKLNMWAETEFSRYLFLDADAFPVAHIDEMFDVPPLRDCDVSKLTLDDWVDGLPWCEPFIFAGTALTVGPDAKPEINCGSMVFTPSKRAHKRFLQNYLKTDSYNVIMSEQGFLNWQFRVDGAFPATQLERKWGSIYTADDEEGKMNIVHEKLWWDESATRGENWLDREWKNGWEEMVRFYESEEFATEREKDGPGF